jgi:hypothetical protein
MHAGPIAGTSTTFLTAGDPLAVAAGGFRNREFFGRGRRMGFPESRTGEGAGRCRGLRGRASTAVAAHVPRNEDRRAGGHRMGIPGSLSPLFGRGPVPAATPELPAGLLDA